MDYQHISRILMNRRRFLQYSGSMALSGSLLAACGSTAGGGSSAKTVTLSQWYHQYGQTGTQQAVMNYAKAYSSATSGVTVNVDWVPGDYSGAKLPAALLGSNAPDVFEIPFPTLDMVKAGQLAPLDDIISDVKDDFNPVSLKAVTINGKVYAIKMIDDMGLLYYRKSMFDQAGVQPPTLSTTFDDLIEIAQKMTSNNVKGLYAGNDGGINALAKVALWSGGSDILVDDKIVFDNARTALAFEKIRNLNKTNALLLGAPTDWWDFSSFTQGLAAMQFTGLWAMPDIKKALGDDFGVTPWPALDAQGKPATFWGGWGEAVNGHGKHIEESKAFVKWLWITNIKDQQDWSLDYGFHIPPRKSAASSAPQLKSGPAALAAQYLNDYGHTESPLWTSAMGTIFSDAVSNIVKNGADATTEVHTAAQKCQDELTKLLS